jgi:K+-sensing histidine kinase KdpD
VLVVQEHHDPASSFLGAAAELCRSLQARPVVLTVARTESEAERRQVLAEEAFAARRLHADFDFVVGLDVRTAVASVARWRRCSHVFMERQHAPSWWPWRRGDTITQLLGLTGSLTLLALPDMGPLSQPSAVEQHPAVAGRAANRV